MLSVAGIAVSLTTLVAVAKLVQTLVKWLHLPPGPWGLPYFGYIFFLPEFGKMPALFVRWSKIHGDIFSVCLGMHEVIVLNTTEAIVDCFKMPENVNGTDTFTLSLEYEVGSSRLFAAGLQQKDCKQSHWLMVSTTRNSSLEVNAQKGCKWLLEKWKHMVGVAFEDRADLKTMACSVQGALVFGGEPGPDNIFVSLITTYQDLPDFRGILNSFLEFFPRLRFLYRSRIENQKKIVEKVCRLFGNGIRPCSKQG